MSKSKIGYKVLSIGNNKLWSVYATSISQKGIQIQLGVEYEVNKLTVPLVKGTKLFAFTDLKSAKEYLQERRGSMSTIGPFCIYKAKLNNPVANGWFTQLVWELNDVIEIFKGNKEVMNRCLWYKTKPDFDNSVVCTSIKLIEKVEV